MLSTILQFIVGAFLGFALVLGWTYIGILKKRNESLQRRVDILQKENDIHKKYFQNIMKLYSMLTKVTNPSVISDQTFPIESVSDKTDIIKDI